MCCPIQGAKVLCVCKLWGLASASGCANVSGWVLQAGHVPLPPNGILGQFLPSYKGPLLLLSFQHFLKPQKCSHYVMLLYIHNGTKRCFFLSVILWWQQLISANLSGCSPTSTPCKSSCDPLHQYIAPFFGFIKFCCSWTLSLINSTSKVIY